MIFPFHQKKKKKTHSSVILSLSLSLKTQRARKLKYRSPTTSWGTVVSDLISAASSSDYRYMFNSLFVSREKKSEFVYHGNYLADLSKQLLVFSLILFIGRERQRSIAQRKSGSLIWGLWVWILLELELRSYPLESEVWVGSMRFSLDVLFVFWLRVWTHFKNITRTISP